MMKKLTVLVLAMALMFGATLASAAILSFPATGEGHFFEEGEVYGTYQATVAADELYQEIRESERGHGSNAWTSIGQHYWEFAIPESAGRWVIPGAMRDFSGMEVQVKAHIVREGGKKADVGDNFVFRYSLVPPSQMGWQTSELLEVTSVDIDEVVTACLRTGALSLDIGQWRVWLRVEDSFGPNVQGKDNDNVDTLFVDRLAIVDRIDEPGPRVIVGNKNPAVAYGVWLWDGKQWAERNNGLSSAARSSIVDIEADPHNSGRALLVTRQDGVWQTQDHAGSWQKLDMPGAYENGWGRIAYDAANPGHVVIAGPDQGQLNDPDPRAAFSSDAGLSWLDIDLPLLTDIYLHAPTTLSFHDGVVNMNASGPTASVGELWHGVRSGDDFSWEIKVVGGLGGCVIAADTTPASDDVLRAFCAEASQGSSRASGDAGAIWGAAMPNPTRYGVDMVYSYQTGRFYAMSGEGLWWTPDLGASWVSSIATSLAQGLAVDDWSGDLYASLFHGVERLDSDGLNRVQLGDLNVYGPVTVVR